MDTREFGETISNAVQYFYVSLPRLKQKSQEKPCQDIKRVKDPESQSKKLLM
jgi:hypothetical protein